MIIGGPALNVSLLSKHLPGEYETVLVVGSPDKHEKRSDFLLNDSGIVPIVIPEMGREISMRDDIIAYRKIKEIIKDFKPDIVHTHASKPGAIGRWAASYCKVPVIVHTFHGHVFHSYFSPLKTRLYIEIERKLAQKSTKLIAISELQKQELVNKYRIALADQVEIIPLGLDLEPFRIDREKKRQLFRTEFGLSKDTIAIGIIGRLAPIKNHSLFVEAIAYVAKHSQSNIKAFIIGDGECREQIIRYCETKNLSYSLPENPDPSKLVIFTSWRTDIDVVNAGLDIITLTSLNEGTPVSIIEAQASSKPIVSTICGGIQDVVMENETALLSPIEDHQQFYQNLLRMVEDGVLRNRMSLRGENFAFSKFGYHRLVHEMDTLYRNLLQKAK
jgi:glycosyltransferase involved in cell wall biosynthesis